MNKLVSVLATALAFTQLSASAHAPIVPLHLAHGSASISSAHTLALIHSTHAFGKVPVSGSCLRFLSQVPVSGSSQAFYKSVQFLSGASIKNTVLNSPLSNISGQFNGTLYYNSAPGLTGAFYNFPAIQVFGNNPLNNNAYGGTFAFSNVSNYINGGLAHPVTIFPSSIGMHAVSGAQRQLQGYYNATASAGYNVGLNVLAHPTGGILIGTSYYAYGASSGYSYPGFYAFGNNAFNTQSLQMSTYGQYLTAPSQSYIQFGKITRPITSGFLQATAYYPSSYYPPYGAVKPGTLYPYGNVDFAIGSHPLNTLSLYNYVNLSAYKFTYFK